MKTLMILASVFLFCLPPMHAQNFEWVDYFGKTTSLSIGSIAVDNQGDIYSIGSFKGTVDLDPGPDQYNITSVNGTVDNFVQKLDSEGKFIWGFGYGGEGFDASGGTEDVAVDEDGNVYILGDYGLSVDFDPGPEHFVMTSNGNSDVFLLKLDRDGNFVWARSIGGPNKDGVGGIAIDSKHRIYISGHFKTTTDFDPGEDEFIIVSQGKRDIFLEQLDSMGHMNWVRTLGGIENDYAQEISIDSFDNVYLSGGFYADIIGGAWMDSIALINAGQSDYLLLKVDSNGTFQWVKNFGGRGTDVCYQMDITADNEVNLVGSFQFEVDFNPGSGEPVDTSHGMYDAYLQRFSPEGDVLKTNTFGGKMNDFLTSVINDHFGNTYVYGAFSDTFLIRQDKDTFVFSSQGNLDMFMEKIGPSGQIHWMHTLGGKNLDGILEYNALDRAGNLIIAAIFQDTIDVDPDPINEAIIENPSEIGGCIFKYSQCSFDTTLSIEHHTLTSNSRLTSYQWLDCDNDFRKIPGAVQRSYTAVKNGQYAVEISNGYCKDTSQCGSIISVSTTPSADSKGFILYPNPNKGSFSIEFERKQSNIHIDIMNAIGEDVSSSTYENKTHLEIGPIKAKGIYFMKIKSDELKPEIIKVIVQ